MAVLLLLAAAIPGLGGSSEAREWHVSKLMYQTGDFVLPRRVDILPSKPPLFHWLSACVMSITGRTDIFAARAVSVFAALLMLATVAWTVQRLAPTQVQSQILAPVLLVTTYGFQRLATLSMVDMVFAAAVTAALAPMICALFEPRAPGLSSPAFSRRDWAVFWIAAAIACLTKGPLGAGLVVVALFVLSYAVAGRAACVEIVRPRFSWLLFIVIALPWYLMAWRRAADEFVGRQLVFENVLRLIGGERINRRPFWYYLVEFPQGGAPWSALLLILFPWRTMRRDLKLRSLRGASAGLMLMVLSWVVLFSLASGKRDSYLLPCYPWVSVALSGVLVEWWGGKVGRSRLRVTRVLHVLETGLLLLLLVLAVLPWALSPIFTGKMPLLTYLAIELGDHRFPITMLALIGIVALFRARSVTGSRATLGRGVSWAVGLALAINLGSSAKARFKNYDGDAAAIRQIVGQEPFGVVREVRDESLDAILAFVEGAPRRVDPDVAHVQCPGRYLSNRNFFDEVEAQRPELKVRLLFVGNDLDDRLRNDRSHERVLFGC